MYKFAGNIQVIGLTWPAPDLHPQQLQGRNPRVTRQDINPSKNWSILTIQQNFSASRLEINAIFRILLL